MSKHPLIGSALPSITLPASNGTLVDLSRLDGLTVIYAYPRTSPPDAPPIEGWDEIPGARGCTPQSCGFRDHFAELQSVGVNQVFGLSTQDSVYHAEVVERLKLPFELLSDSNLTLATVLGLEQFEVGGLTLLKRVTLIIKDGRCVHVMNSVDNPASNAPDVMSWIAKQKY